MTAPRYDVIGIGNAIVDVIARAEDDFLVAHGMHKGTMALIDEARAEKIYQAMGPAVESSGGSAANTIVGVASFGGRAAFVGKVKDDELGRAFAHDIRAARVAFDTKPAERRPLDRALLHHGDAGRRAHHEHVSRRGAGSQTRRHRRSQGRQRRASFISKAICGTRRRPRKPSSRRRRSRTRPARRVALTLSDAFCVDRYRAEFLDLIRKGTVDIVFANEHELHSLYETADFDTAVKALRARRQARGGDAQRERLRGGHPQDGRGGAGDADRTRGRRHRRRRSVRRRLPGRAWRAARTTAPPPASARSPPPK